MSEKLLNVKEVCQYLGISEEDLRKLVGTGEIPAYRLGGTILRFRKDQIDKVKSRGIPKVLKGEEALSTVRDSRMEKLKDLLYFNDFYIISAIIIAILLIVIFFT
ncbi:MAG: helix-turn-helix domain-containing protein [Candidatus Omnitrophica bacterium]|nr:helix-turn-helix domain-containing protein [Candidatus Omnitrophota bacterium]